MLCAGVLVFWRLGQGSLWDWDEAIYGSVAKQLSAGGDWLTLRLGGRYWPEKPPLVLWCQALMFRGWGVGEFTARFPSALCGWLSVGLAYLAGRRFFSPRAGLLAGVFLLTTLHFLMLSRMAMLDVPMGFFIAYAIFGYWDGLRREWQLAAAGIAVGLAVMTKGAVGLLPWAVLGVWSLIAGEWARWRRPAFWVGVAGAAAVVLPWHLIQISRQGTAFTDYYFRFNLLARLVEAVEGHTGTVLFYPKYILEHYFSPWLVFSGLLAAAAFVRHRREFWAARNNPEGYLAVAVAVPLVLFSLARTKVAGYIAPVYFPLALWTAQACLAAWDRRWVRWSLGAVLTAAAVQMGVLAVGNGLIVDPSAEVKELGLRHPRLGGELIAYRIPPNAPAFYFPVPARNLSGPDEVGEALRRSPKVTVLCDSTGWDQLRNRFPLRTLDISRNGRYRLLEPGIPQETDDRIAR